MSNSYSFRTVGNDNYFQRVMDEADAKTNFMLITDEDKVSGSRNLATFVRKEITALSLLLPELKLGSLPLRDYLEQVYSKPDNAPFVVLTSEGPREAIDKLKETIEQDMRHITNIVKGRTIQVTVQSF